MTWSELPYRVKLLILTLATIALPIVLWSLVDVVSKPIETGWIVLSLLSLFTIPFFLLLPSVSTIINIGDAYIMAIAMIYGVSPCIIATLSHTLSASLFVPNRPKIYVHRVVFNVSSMVCGAFVYSWVYRLATPTHQTGIHDIILPAVALTLTFFSFNSLLTATTISWATGKSVLAFWSSQCMPLAIDFSVSAVSATLIVGVREFHPLMPLAVAPLIGVVWGWNKLNKAKAMEAEKHLKDQEALYLRTVESLALAVDAKDQTTYGHIRRVRAYALGLARLSGITDTTELMAIETGSLLHDIGKLAIDDYILNKPGRLSKEEFEKMKLHAPAGDEILRQIQFPFPVAQYVRYHHERWDGTGYPDGLKAHQIPLGARILAIADAFDAIRSSRPYKLSFGIAESVQLLRTQSGTMYDPALLELFVAHIDQLEASAAAAAQNIPQLSFRRYLNTPQTEHSLPTTPPSHALSPYLSSELLSILDLCHGIDMQLSLKEIMPILSSRLSRLIPFATCAIFFEANDLLRAVFVTGKFSEHLQSMELGLGKGISGWVTAYRKPIFNTSPALEFQNLLGDFTSLTDTLVVPIIIDAECIGTISLYAEPPIFYSQTHLELLQLIAHQTSPLLARLRSRDLEPTGIALDPTTHLYGPSYLSLAGNQILLASEANRSPFSLLYFDLTNLNPITTLFGPLAASQVLQKTAGILRSELRETDVLVRFGTSAFIALLPGVRAEQASRLGSRIQNHLRTTCPQFLPSQHFNLLSQVGLASFPTDGNTLVTLLASAQQHMENRTPKTDLPPDSYENVIEFPRS